MKSHSDELPVNLYHEKRWQLCCKQVFMGLLAQERERWFLQLAKSDLISPHYFTTNHVNRVNIVVVCWLPVQSQHFFFCYSVFLRFLPTDGTLYKITNSLLRKSWTFFTMDNRPKHKKQHKTLQQWKKIDFSWSMNWYAAIWGAVSKEGQM